MKVTSKDIGDMLYPCDNSFIHNVTENKAGDILLAGSQYTSAKQVKIISPPYKETINIWNGPIEYEFVNVKYEDNIYRVLNTFSVTQISTTKYLDHLNIL